MAQNTLFELIHSMSMSEKRHFKLFSLKHVIGDKNQYTLLFDAIDKQKKYNEKNLNDLSFVKNLSAEKNYLYRLILKSLNAFHSKLNSKNKIYNWLQSVEILYHKGLYQQALKLTKKASELAKENDLFIQELAVREVEAELMSKQFLYTDAIQNIERSEKVMQVAKNFNAIQKIAMQSYEKGFEMGMTRSAKDLKKIKTLIEKEEVKSAKNCLSSRAEMYRLGMLLSYFYLINDSIKMLEFTKKLTSHYQKNSFLIEYSMIGYIFSLSSLARAYTQNRQEEKAIETLQILDECQIKYNFNNSPKIAARIFFYSLNNRLDISLNKDDYKKCGQLLKTNEREFEKLSPFIGKPLLYEYYFLTTKYYFVIGEFRKALRCTNVIINDSSFKAREDLLSVIRLINLLIYFELNTDFTLGYLTKNTYNYFKKRKRLFKVEDELIRFMKNQNKIQSKAILKKDLLQLKESMQKWKKHKFEYRPFQQFDFEYWAKAKLEKKLICELN